MGWMVLLAGLWLLACIPGPARAESVRLPLPPSLERPSTAPIPGGKAAAETPAPPPGPAAPATGAPRLPTPPRVDFAQVARVYPNYKVVLLLEFDQPLDLPGLRRLRSLGARPQGSGAGAWLTALGRRRGLFFAQAKYIAGIRRAGVAARVTPLERFTLHALYTVAFEIKEAGFQGGVSFRVSGPREGYGKRLLSSQASLSPRMASHRSTDAAGNRWLEVAVPEAAEGSKLRIDFYATYAVDVAQHLRHAINMVPPSETAVLPAGSPLAEFLMPSEKITSTDPQVVALAQEIFQGERRPRLMWGKLYAWLKKKLPYDWQKRREFFGGQKVYCDMAEMHLTPAETLAQGFAACPSTSVLEAALWRAAGVPARTAGRWSHFFTEIYLPGPGWVSTSVTPTGIPLVKDSDRRLTPFVSWEPRIEVQTTRWTGGARVALEDR